MCTLTAAAVLAVVLAWGPASAFHLGNFPFLATLWIGAEPGFFWQPLVPGGVSLLAGLQIGTLFLAGALGAIALWGVRGRYVKDRGSFPAFGWRALLGLRAVYWAVSLGPTLKGAVPFRWGRQGLP